MPSLQFCNLWMFVKENPDRKKNQKETIDLIGISPPKMFSKSFLTFLFIMLKNGQTYFKNLGLFTTQDF